MTQTSGLSLIQLKNGQTITLQPGWSIIIYASGPVEGPFQASNTSANAYLQYIDPLLINEFLERYNDRTFLLNALNNKFDGSQFRND